VLSRTTQSHPNPNLPTPDPHLYPPTSHPPHPPLQPPQPQPPGLLRYCDRRIPSHVLRRAYKIVFDIPFNSANKWAVTVTQCPGMMGKNVVMMKGGWSVLRATWVGGAWFVAAKVVQQDRAAAAEMQPTAESSSSARRQCGCLPSELNVHTCTTPQNPSSTQSTGAPEIVLTKCSHHLHNRQEKPMDEVRT